MSILKIHTKAAAAAELVVVAQVLQMGAKITAVVLEVIK
jgi:predicted peptidase